MHGLAFCVLASMLIAQLSSTVACVAGFLEVDGDQGGKNEHIQLTKMQSDTLRRLWVAFGPDEQGAITHQDLKAGLTLLGKPRYTLL
jgi:hypothetical protein